MTTSTRQSLSIDLDTLFPGESLKIGNSHVIIRPLSLQQIATVSLKVKDFLQEMGRKDITFSNYESGANMVEVVVTLLQEFPDVLEEVTNIAVADLEQLPLDVVVELVGLVIEVNMKSKDTLEKNFKSLAEKFTDQAPLIKK
ncbi:MAG: hypothetical protein P9L97_05970 [Candidatus Tenebribacter davisii]|nr:hypothetical protein [Candidatus Tenebribacter davisii]